MISGCVFVWLAFCIYLVVFVFVLTLQMTDGSGVVRALVAGVF